VNGHRKIELFGTPARGVGFLALKHALEREGEKWRGLLRGFLSLSLSLSLSLCFAFAFVFLRAL